MSGNGVNRVVRCAAAFILPVRVTGCVAFDRLAYSPRIAIKSVVTQTGIEVVSGNSKNLLEEMKNASISCY